MDDPKPRKILPLTFNSKIACLPCRKGKGDRKCSRHLVVYNQLRQWSTIFFVGRKFWYEADKKKI